MSENPKAKPGRPRKRDPEAILAVAMRAYWQNDPLDVSLNAICEMAGASKPALYRAFGSEDGLMRAALDRYADRVLSDVFDLLAQAAPLKTTLAALVRFAGTDPKMETGCVFYKMRAGKHRLGPQTRSRVEEIDAAAVQGFEAYLDARREDGDEVADLPTALAARYLVEQIGLALTQRASGVDPVAVQTTLALAFSVLAPARMSDA
ncbi:MAG: TetR/AcrR family transcriptional regulator [Pseudomonadota bacterium]